MKQRCQTGFLLLCFFSIAGLFISHLTRMAPEKFSIRAPPPVPAKAGLGIDSRQRATTLLPSLPEPALKPAPALSRMPVSGQTLSHPTEKTQPLSEEKAVVAQVSKDECPCSSDLEELKVKDVPREFKTNLDLLISFFQREKLKAQKGLGDRREVLDSEFEEPLFRHPPLRHSACLPDHRRSQVSLLTPRDQISVGSPVQFRIDIYNGCGRPRSHGGDVIRAWFKSEDGNSSVAAKVKDLQNGSYVGETVLPWPGVTLIRVSLTYAQEFLRLSVEFYHTLHSMRWTTETMKSGAIEERVPCLPSTPVPGYASTCNFTALNGGYPWFCGHPVTKGLNCSHRHVFNSLPSTGPLPIPPAFRQYYKTLTRCCRHRPMNPDLRQIPNDIRLEAAHETARFPPPLPPCSSRPVKESWVTPSPRGWLRHGQWMSSTCTLPHLTKKRVQRCMKNSALLLHGDSNQRELFKYIMKYVGCTESLESSWTAPRVCKNSALQSTMVQTSHALPFRPGIHGNFPVANLAISQALLLMKNVSYQGSKAVTVVLHYYLHPSSLSVQVYRSLVQAARKTVQEYLKQHPTAKFLIRGPHTVYDGNTISHMHIGDKFADWYVKIWQEEFAGLSDRVWYLDIWDMTVASENLDIHPPLQHQIAQLLFGYFCNAG